MGNDVLPFAALVLLSSTGCGNIFKGMFGPPRPALESYRLNIPAPSPTANATRRTMLPGRLAIAPYVTRGVYASNGIVFRLTVIFTSCRRSSASLPVHCVRRRSTCSASVSWSFRPGCRSAPPRSASSSGDRPKALLTKKQIDLARASHERRGP